MPITYHKSTKEFHIYNNFVSYIIKILENNQPGHLYFGKRLTDKEDFSYMVEYAKRDMAPCSFEGNSFFSLEHLKQEYPTCGSGDMRTPAFIIEDINGSRAVDFKYKKHNIFPGKKKLDGLPAIYTENDSEATTLELYLEDSILNAEIILSYTIFENEPAISRHTYFNCKGKTFTILNAMSTCLDLPDKEYKMIKLRGAWGRERHIDISELSYGVQSIYSLRGCSSHQFNPFLALKRKNADENLGEVLGLNLIYSGDFFAGIEVDNFDVTRIVMGIHPSEFRWELNFGESFQTPEVLLVYSNNGIGEMSRTFHRIYQKRLVRGVWRDKVRPILLNTWEATYFDFNENTILNLADSSEKIGIELLVIDDGWFGKRNSDKSSLGDWYVNSKKFSGGLKYLSEKLKEKGLKLGLWIEPEMVNKDSELFKKHPDWILADIKRNYCHSRNQYVLDFSKREVIENIYKQISEILYEGGISYVKWDMNRSFSEVFSNGMDKAYQGKVRHKYILGVYELYERLISRFPEILFESCASGGARFDPGMLYYSPQVWTSDNTDAMDRVKIQHGTSYVYPLSTIGSHMSASPNHQIFRSTSAKTRGNVAFFGTFGYETDIRDLSKEEIDLFKEQIIFMKKHRKLIQFGKFYRLKSPFENNSSSWMVVSEDTSEALMVYFRLLQPINGKFEKIYLAGLNDSSEYIVKEEFAGNSGYFNTHYGDELMYSGLSMSDYASGLADIAGNDQGDFMSRLFYIKKKYI